MGWTTLVALRRFRRAGWCYQETPRSEWVVSRDRLTAVMPSVMARLDELDAAGMLVGKRGQSDGSKRCRLTGGRRKEQER